MGSLFFIKLHQRDIGLALQTLVNFIDLLSQGNPVVHSKRGLFRLVLDFSWWNEGHLERICRRLLFFDHRDLIIISFHKIKIRIQIKLIK